MGHRHRSTGDRYGSFAPNDLKAARRAADIGLQKFDPMEKIGAGDGI